MTLAAVLHPSAARIVRQALSDALGTHVATGRKVPQPRPSTFVTVSRFGGSQATPVSDMPQLGVEVWAPDPDAAEDLAQQARLAIRRLVGTTIGGMVVYFVHDVSGPVDLPHPSGHPRFVFTVEMHVRSAA